MYLGLIGQTTGPLTNGHFQGEQFFIVSGGKPIALGAAKIAAAVIWTGISRITDIQLGFLLGARFVGN